jgi:LDH2 family malate/lactate/ureidoglycolate dehydrogenase
MIPLDEVDRCACGAIDPVHRHGHGHFMCDDCNEMMLAEMYAEQLAEALCIGNPSTSTSG